MSIPEKYIKVVPLVHPGTPDGTLTQINPEYVKHLEECIEVAKHYCLVQSSGDAYSVLTKAIN